MRGDTQSLVRREDKTSERQVGHHWQVGGPLSRHSKEGDVMVEEKKNKKQNPTSYIFPSHIHVAFPGCHGVLLMPLFISLVTKCLWPSDISWPCVVSLPYLTPSLILSFLRLHPESVHSGSMRRNLFRCSVWRISLCTSCSVNLGYNEKALIVSVWGLPIKDMTHYFGGKCPLSMAMMKFSRTFMLWFFKFLCRNEIFPIFSFSLPTKFCMAKFF